MQHQTPKRRKRGKYKKSALRYRTKSGAKPRGREDARRKEEMEEAGRKVNVALESLVNPYDNMNIDEKKELGLFLYYRRLQVMFVYEYFFLCVSGHLTDYQKKNRSRSHLAKAWHPVALASPARWQMRWLFILMTIHLFLFKGWFL